MLPHTFTIPFSYTKTPAYFARKTARFAPKKDLTQGPAFYMQTKTFASDP